MPTHPLLAFAESPGGLGQDILTSSSASMPGAGSSMTPHSPAAEEGVSQPGGLPLCCMFCDETFARQEELGPHVLSQHPTTLFGPAVLRVEAEFRIPGERARPKPPVAHPLEKEEVPSCIVCGQVSQDAGELETHMRKHKDYFTYGCNVCGRRFREPWFLKNHMKMHVGKPGAKGKAQQDLETPVTINGVVQDQSTDPVVTVYKMCMVCGFFFPDQESLAEHSKGHNREVEPGKEKNKEDQDAEASGDRGAFLQGLRLRPRSDGNDSQPERSSKWIAQLDPFNTYQAWQLATKGKVAVGPNIAKDAGQDASTDNEDFGSDKEELSGIWSEGQGRELRSRQPTATETPSPEPDKKTSLLRKDKDKERPTNCEECGRTFKTYHQLVLHSRVHKRERGGEESPTVSIDRAEEASEDGYEDGAVAEALASDGFERTKVRGIASRECSYCGKTFRSSYYLNVHLRTHTGEKPFKCVYCDYAAAQKTSLKYHLERRHKDKPFTEIPSRPVPLTPSPTEREHRITEKNPVPNRSKLWVPGPRLGANVKPEDRFHSIDPAKPLAQVSAEYERLIAKTAHSPADEVLIKCPVPVNLKTERKEMNEDSFEAPLNLSLKVSLAVSQSSEPRNAILPIACSSCAYKTLYPEVLVMHRRLTHKDKSDAARKSLLRGGPKQKRFTGCPPALDGKDVAPLPAVDRRHPRRTKSPTPQPARPQEKTPPSNRPPQPAPKRSPLPVPVAVPPRPEAVPEMPRYRAAAEPHAGQGSSRFTELAKESGSSRYVMGRLGPSDRVGIGERSYPVRNNVVWPSDAARLCLSSRFGNLPHMDLGEPSMKRLKYSMLPGSQTDGADKPGFRIPAPTAADGSSRLLISGRSMKTSSQPGSSPSELPEAFGPVKALTPTGGGGMDTDWNMINILRSYSPSDLAQLYHGTAPNPSHGGLANPRPGSRTALYQHLPTLPNLQRRDHSGPIPNERYGTTDKTA